MFLHNVLKSIQLYGILDLAYVTAGEVLPIVRKMIEGGIEILQLRAKLLSQSEIIALAQQIQPLCNDAGIPFIINDYPALVPVVQAEGVHVGQDDRTVCEARNLAAEKKIVGKSTHSLAQARAAEVEGADYIGFGPLFATSTKPDYIPIGLQDIAEVHAQVKIPIFCIGGIKIENLREVVAAGAQRVVIVSGILQAKNVVETCQECLGFLKGSSSFFTASYNFHVEKERR